MISWIFIQKNDIRETLIRNTNISIFTYQATQWNMCTGQCVLYNLHMLDIIIQMYFKKKSKMWFHILSDWTFYFVVNAQHNSRIEPQWLVCAHSYIQIIPISGVYCTFRYAFTWLNIFERLITKALAVPLVHTAWNSLFFVTHTNFYISAYTKVCR